jgi:hypothetical protein
MSTYSQPTTPWTTALCRITFHCACIFSDVLWSKGLGHLILFFFSSSFLLPRIGFDSSAHPVGTSVMVLGGFGFLSRLHGLSIDNLVEAEAVLADGSIVIVNEKEHPGNVLSSRPPPPAL